MENNAIHIKSIYVEDLELISDIISDFHHSINSTESADTVLIALRKTVSSGMTKVFSVYHADKPIGATFIRPKDSFITFLYLCTDLSIKEPDKRLLILDRLFEHHVLSIS